MVLSIFGYAGVEFCAAAKLPASRLKRHTGLVMQMYIGAPQRLSYSLRHLPVRTLRYFPMGWGLRLMLRGGWLMRDGPAETPPPGLDPGIAVVPKLGGVPEDVG